MVNVQSLYTALAPLGFEAEGAVCFGSWRGYAVSLRSAQYSFFQVTFAVRADKKDKALSKAVSAALKQRLGKSLSAVMNKGDSFLFSLRFSGKTDYAEQFRLYADAIAEVLAANGLAPACTCAVCGGGTPESLGLIESYQPVHAACMRQKAETAKEQVLENQENGSYLTGTVGAILGALVGSILPLVMLIATDTLYAILFALVPLASMYGYRLFKGKSNKISIVIVVVICILAVCLMAYVIVIYYLVSDYHMDLGQAMRFFSQFVDGSEFAELLGEFWKGFVFMLLGIFISWGYLSKTSVSEARGAEALLGTLRPNPLYTQQRAADDLPEQE